MGVAELHNFRDAVDARKGQAANRNVASTDMLEMVMGFVISGAGHRVRAGAMLRPDGAMKKYSHVGEVPLPADMLEEFREGHKRFFFYADTGEEFDEIHVIDQLETGRAVTEEGTIVLLRKAQETRLN